jgi:hypothetical protein
LVVDEGFSGDEMTLDFKTIVMPLGCPIAAGRDYVASPPEAIEVSSPDEVKRSRRQMKR